MMPFPGLYEVKIQWLAIQQGNYKIYGFLIYTGSDTAIVEFLKEGIVDLDILSGEECAIFLIEPPSKRWIDYVKKKNHPWSQYLNYLTAANHEAQDASENALDDTDLAPNTVLLQDIRNAVVVVGHNNHVSMNQLLEPDYESLFDRSEAYKVAEHFHIAKNEIPCLVFFKNLNDDVIWMQPLEEYDTQKALKVFFRSFFESPAFKSFLG